MRLTIYHCLKIIFITLISIIWIDCRSVTYPGIGTFNSDDFYDPIYRPFALYLPFSPQQCDVHFILYTRRNQNNPETLDYNNTEQIKHSKFFNSSKPTKIYISGHTDHPDNSPYIYKLKDNYLAYEDINWIVVEFNKANENVYGQDVVNARVVGAMIGVQIRSMIRELGGHYSDYHLMGHSLGAHVAAYAGKFLNGKLGRITGFDPAGPYFEHLPPAARLWYTDALFVDSIHTDSRTEILTLGLGMEETYSHIDFYVNGGNYQPGCLRDQFSIILEEFHTA